MKSNEEFKSEVYGRFEKYKVEKAKKRRNIIRYGSITMSALIVAVAVASPTFFGVEGKQSAYYEDQSPTAPEKEVNVYSQKSGGVYNDSDKNTDVFSIDETLNGQAESVTVSEEDTRVDTAASSTAAPTPAASTPAVIPAEEASTAAATVGEATVLDTTACATANVTESTAGPSATATESASFNTTPKIRIENVESIEKYLIGTEVFANEESASSAENNAKSAGVDIKRYKFCDHSSDGERSCVALNDYGLLNVIDCSDDGETVVVTGYIINTDVEPISKSMNIFIFDGDREIVFNIKIQ